MSYWIKIEHVTPDKPEVMQIAKLTGLTENEILGGLVRFWVWCDTQSQNGHAIGVTKSGLDRISCVPGMYDAMTKVGWLTEDSDGVHVPNFDYHLSENAKKRAKDAKRKADQRLATSDEQCHVQDLSADCPQKDGTEVRPEKEKEKEKSKKEEKKSSRSRETWLTPFDSVWKKTLGGSIPFGQAAKVLKPLVDEHGTDKVVAHLGRYLDTTEAKYVSLARFAATFGTYDGTYRSPEVLKHKSPLEILDECERWRREHPE